jgi:hypothetical protein
MFFCVGALAAGGAVAAEADADGALAARARAVLHQVVETDRTWVRVHAAEALISAGEGEAMHARFLRDWPANETAVYRVGIWRVLANTARDGNDRAGWIARVERVFLDPKAPDRAQAVETLGKLRHRVAGTVLEAVRAKAAAGPEAEAIVPLWVLHLAKEPGALARLTAALGSADATTRLRAAYASRWLHASDAALRRALALAADIEPEDSPAYAYVLSAALSLDARPARSAAWLAKLDHVLATGTAAARFEACQTLMRRLGKSDVPRFVPLLADADPDTRVGAAWSVLHLLGRRR